MSLSNHQLFEMINASPAAVDGWAWMSLSLSRLAGLPWVGSVWTLPAAIGCSMASALRAAHLTHGT